MHASKFYIILYKLILNFCSLSSSKMVLDPIEAFSSMTFAERLEQRKAELESCQSLRDLLKLLDILMFEFLKHAKVRMTPVTRSSPSYCKINQFVYCRLYIRVCLAGTLPELSSAEATPQPMARAAEAAGASSSRSIP